MMSAETMEIYEHPSLLEQAKRSPLFRGLTAFAVGSAALFGAGCESSKTSGVPTPSGGLQQNVSPSVSPQEKPVSPQEAQSEADSQVSSSGKDCSYDGITCTEDEAMAQCKRELESIGEESYAMSIMYKNPSGEVKHVSC